MTQTPSDYDVIRDRDDNAALDRLFGPLPIEPDPDLERDEQILEAIGDGDLRALNELLARAK